MRDKPETNFFLNGNPADCTADSSLYAYLETAGVDPRAVVAEVNGNILKPDGFAAHIIADGDKIEVIHFVDGG